MDAYKSIPHNKIRLLHIIGSLFHGGMERLMLNILSLLPKDTFDITVCCFANLYLHDVAQAFQEAGIKIIVFPQQPGIRLIHALNNFIRQERFHIIHTHYYYGNLHCRLAAILTNTPIIMTYQHHWPGEEKWRHRFAFRLLNLWTYKNLTVSEAIRRYDIELAGLSPDKVVTVHNGVDTFIFQPASMEQRLEMQLALVLPPTSKVVGMVGRLVDWKRFDLFIQAAALVLRSGRNVHFLIVGDGEMRKSLLQLTHHLNLENRIHFLGWQKDTPAIYQAMDIFCLTSDSGGRSLSMYGGEGFGLVSIEAMASGLPIVAVDTEVNREVISEDCGLFCIPTPDDLAAKICQLIDSSSLRYRLGQNGRARVIERFNIIKTVERLSNIYLQALSNIPIA